MSCSHAKCHNILCNVVILELLWKTPRCKVENISRNSLLDNTHTTAKEKHEGRMVMPITFHQKMIMS